MHLMYRSLHPEWRTEDVQNLIVLVIPVESMLIKNICECLVYLEEAKEEHSLHLSEVIVVFPGDPLQKHPYNSTSVYKRRKRGSRTRDQQTSVKLIGSKIKHSCGINMNLS